MYVIALSAIAVLVFAAIAVAQSVPEGQKEGQKEGQEPSQNTPIATDANTTGEQNSTTVPAKKEPAETTTPTETTTPAESTAPDTTITMAVHIDNHAFDPPQLNIAPGTRVMFINDDTEPHTATADNDLFDTGELEPGDTSWIIFEGAGTVTYHCESHPDMKGSIVVGEGGGGGDTTLQKQQTAEEAPNEPNMNAAKPASEAAKIVATEAAKPARGY
jgi:plastocyanin